MRNFIGRYSAIFLLLLFSLTLHSCASIERRGVEDGTLVTYLQTYELLVMENYDLLKLMDEEGDTGPSRRRNLVVARLNSALAHLGGMIAQIEKRKRWPALVYEMLKEEGYLARNRAFAAELKERWAREWKESFDDEDPENYREVAIDTYLRCGNPFGIDTEGEGSEPEKTDRHP